MKLMHRLIDKIQATFPPNRVMILLAGPITAASLWISAWVANNVPGVELPVAVVAGFMGTAGLITITLIYKWFDQWQLGERTREETGLAESLETDDLIILSAHFNQAINALKSLNEDIDRALDAYIKEEPGATLQQIKAAGEAALHERQHILDSLARSPGFDLEQLYQ